MSSNLIFYVDVSEAFLRKMAINDILLGKYLIDQFYFFHILLKQNDELKTIKIVLNDRKLYLVISYYFKPKKLGN